MPRQPKEPIQIADTAPGKEREFPFLIYAQIEFEVKALDPESAEKEAAKFFDKITAEHKENYLRIKEAKVADPSTGYFFKK